MKRLSNLSRWFFVCISFCAFNGFAQDKTVNESALWLPKKHESHYLKLKEMATLVANTPRCEKLLEATLDLEKTTRMFVFYRVLCRDPNGRTYIEIVDGNTSEILQEEKPPKQRLALCLKQLNKQTALMNKVEFLFEEPVLPSKDEDDVASYELPFNAQTMQGKVLKYKAFCSVSDVILSFDIQSRIAL